MAIAFLILGMAGVTFLTRYLQIALAGRWWLPPALARWLRYIPIAAFTAIVVQGTLEPGGRLSLAPTNPYLWGAAAAAVAAWWRKGVLLAIAAGLAGLWLARLVAGT